MVKVLLVTNNKIHRDHCRKIATGNGHAVEETSDGKRAMEMIKSSNNGFDRIITATDMGEGNGIELLTWLYNEYGSASRPLTLIHNFYPEYEVGETVYDLPRYIQIHFKGTVCVLSSDSEDKQIIKFLERSIPIRRRGFGKHPSL